MTDYGIKISKNGYDISSATDDELVMSSKMPLYKVWGSGSAQLTTDAETGYAQTNITHNLGYHPAFIAFTSDPDTANVRRRMTYYVGSVGTFAWTTTTDLYLKVFWGGDGTKTYDLYYYIFYDLVSS